MDDDEFDSYLKRRDVFDRIARMRSALMRAGAGI